MKLELLDVSCGYSTRTVLQNVSFPVNSGDFVCLLGPNGIGKTTLFKTILGLLPPLGGSVLLDGRDISTIGTTELAKLISYVPQAHNTPFAFQVLEVVLIGRTSHIGLFASPKAADYDIAWTMLERLGISHLAKKPFTEISGGERQLVFVARALAQQPKFLLMDEPTANLDFGNQIRVLDTVRSLTGQGLGILMTSHAPDHAFLCANHAALLLSDGSLRFGSVDEVLTEESLHAAYGVDVRLAEVTNNDGKTVKTCVPMFLGSDGGGALG